jgi:hypothetical protein
MKRKMETDPMQRKIKTLKKDLFHFQLRPTLWYLGVCFVLYVPVWLLLSWLLSNDSIFIPEGIQAFLFAIHFFLFFSSLPIVEVFLLIIGFTTIVMRMNPCLQQGVTRQDFMGKLIKSAVGIVLMVVVVQLFFSIIYTIINAVMSPGQFFFFWFDSSAMEEIQSQEGEGVSAMYISFFNTGLTALSTFCRCLIYLSTGLLIGLSVIAFLGKKRIVTAAAGVVVLITQIPILMGNWYYSLMYEMGQPSGLSLFIAHLHNPIEEMGTIIQRAVIERRDIFSAQFPRPALNEDNMYIDINMILAVLLTLLIAIGLPFLLKHITKRIEIRVK